MAFEYVLMCFMTKNSFFFQFFLFHFLMRTQGVCSWPDVKVLFRSPHHEDLFSNKYSPKNTNSSCFLWSCLYTRQGNTESQTNILIIIIVSPLRLLLISLLVPIGRRVIFWGSKMLIEPEILATYLSSRIITMWSAPITIPECTFQLLVRTWGGVSVDYS